MSTEHKRSPWLLMVAIVIGIPVIYVLSSGPMISLAGRRQVLFKKLPDGRHSAVTLKNVFWETLYAPLVWSADRKWGEPLNWYWSQFPDRSRL